MAAKPNAAQQAEELLLKAEELIREAEQDSRSFKFKPKADHIAASDAVVGGKLVRVVSIISEKSPTFSDVRESAE